MMHLIGKKPRYIFAPDNVVQEQIRAGLSAQGSFSRIGLTELKLYFALKKCRINLFLPALPRHLILLEAQRNAGIYFNNRKEEEQFISEMEAHTPLVEMASLPSIYYDQFSKLNNIRDTYRAGRIMLRHYEPYLFPNNYFDLMANQKITIVTSFAHTVRFQIPKFRKLHEHINVDCNFEVISAPTTNANFVYDGISFFQRLEDLECRIIEAANKFVLIGAGGYGHLIAKRLSLKGFNVMVIGGGIQILFGIIGRRWEQRLDFQQMFNEHWIKPLPEDIPDGSGLVEGGCYW